MSLVTREGKGSKLTVQEMDGNLTYLEKLGTTQNGENKTINIDFPEIKNTTDTGNVSVVLSDTTETYDIISFDKGYISIQGEVSIDTNSIITILGDPDGEISSTFTVLELVNKGGILTTVVISGVLDYPEGSELTLTLSGVEYVYGIKDYNAYELLNETYIDLFINDGEVPFVEGMLATITYQAKGNNGVYTINSVNYDEVVDVTNITPNEILNNSNPTPIGVTADFRVIKKAEYSWVHGVMPNGVVIWEAYDNNSNDDITGYWVAVRNNNEGEFEVLSILKMTQNFWDNWYSWTYKDDSIPNQIKLIDYNYIDGNGPWSPESNAGSYVATLTLNSNNELEISETLFNLEKTWADLVVEYTGLGAGTLTFYQPESDSYDDWYGMQKGPNAGWLWYTVNGGVSLNIKTSVEQQWVGYNLLTGESKFLDYLSGFNDIPVKILNGVLPIVEDSNYYISAISNAKYEVVFWITEQTQDYNNNEYFWSPALGTESAIEFSPKDVYGSQLYFQISIVDKYVIVNNNVLFFNNTYPYLSIPVLDLETGILKYHKKPLIGDIYNGIFTSPYSWSNNGTYFITKDSIIFGLHPGNNRNEKLITFNTLKNSVEVCDSSVYPNDFTTDSIITYDRIWDSQSITSVIETYKNNTF